MFTVVRLQRQNSYCRQLHRRNITTKHRRSLRGFPKRSRTCNLFPANMCDNVSNFGAKPWNYNFDIFQNFYNYPYMQPKWRVKTKWAKYALNVFIVRLYSCKLFFRTQAGFGHYCNKNKNIYNFLSISCYLYVPLSVVSSLTVAWFDCERLKTKKFWAEM